ETGATVFQILDVSDAAVQQHMDAIFNSSTTLPEKGEYKGDNRARVVGDYKLLCNNCATTVSDALIKTGSRATEKLPNKAGIQIKDRFIIPSSLQSFLKWQSSSFLGNRSVKVHETHK